MDEETVFKKMLADADGKVVPLKWCGKVIGTAKWNEEKGIFDAEVDDDLLTEAEHKAIFGGHIDYLSVFNEEEE